MDDVFEYYRSSFFGGTFSIRIEGNIMNSVPTGSPREIVLEKDIRVSDEFLANLRKVLVEVDFANWPSRHEIDDQVMDSTEYRIRAGNKVVSFYHEGPEGWERVCDVFEDRYEDVEEPDE